MHALTRYMHSYVTRMLIFDSESQFERGHQKSAIYSGMTQKKTFNRVNKNFAHVKIPHHVRQGNKHCEKRITVISKRPLKIF